MTHLDDTHIWMTRVWVTHVWMAHTHLDHTHIWMTHTHLEHTHIWSTLAHAAPRSPQRARAEPAASPSLHQHFCCLCRGHGAGRSHTHFSHHDNLNLITGGQNVSEVLWICSDVIRLKCNYFSRSQAGAGRLRQRSVGSLPPEPHGAPRTPRPATLRAQRSHEAPTTPPGHFF